MEVWGYKRTFETVAEVDRVFTDKDFSEFLALPDFMVITLPSTPDTLHLFDENAFKAMKKTAVLINVGRGSVVSEKALVRALDAREIGGAVLDVFEKEPLTKASPLWTNPNVLITPHISALSFPEDIVNIFAENYRRFISDQPLLHVIDFNQRY
jgi:phosphoglycerate dehydrogenase-like enzyme